MFRRRKKVEPPVLVPPTADEGRYFEVIERTTPLGTEPRAWSAAEAIAPAHVATMRRDPEARLFLILAPVCHPTGLAPEWQFMYLLPNRHAEVTVTVHCTGGATGIPEVAEYVTPVPAPGTPAFSLTPGGGSFLLAQAEEAWRARLELLRELPLPFVNSTEAVPVLDDRFPNLFLSGAARVRGRRTLEGIPVWEASTLLEVRQVPLRPQHDQRPLPLDHADTLAQYGHDVVSDSGKAVRPVDVDDVWQETNIAVDRRRPFPAARPAGAAPRAAVGSLRPDRADTPDRA